MVTVTLGLSARTGLVVALGLAQIGEFSFILGDLARHNGLLGEDGYSLLVACAMVSISLNPFLFRLLDPIEGRLRRHKRLWRLLDARSARKRAAINARTAEAIEAEAQPLAVIVGYGPVGQAVDRALRRAGTDTVVIDLNMDTVAELEAKGQRALFGDASQPGLLEQAGIARARHLIVTLPHSVNRAPLIAAARELSPRCRIVVRARYLREYADLIHVGANAACFEEAEAAAALTEVVLADLGLPRGAASAEGDRVRQEALERFELETNG
jgi:CPA2 family monovalent cation:H+ antiporter-2